MAKKGGYFDDPGYQAAVRKFHENAGKPGGMSLFGSKKGKAKKGWPPGVYILVSCLFGYFYYVTWGSPFKK